MDAKTNKMKSSAAELDLILELVIEMVIKGHSRTDIIRYFKDPANTTKSERSVDFYISNARKEIKKRFNKQRENQIALAAARYEDLYKKNYQIQDYRECRNVQDSLNKITGISVANKIELTGKDGGPIESHNTLTVNIVNTETGVASSEKEILEQVERELLDNE